MDECFSHCLDVPTLNRLQITKVILSTNTAHKAPLVRRRETILWVSGFAPFGDNVIHSIECAGSRVHDRQKLRATGRSFVLGCNTDR